MQDIHSLAGGDPPAERLFVAAAVTGDGRLLRPGNQALKCPRCDSLNTKFCYYNNYNLSQPRHFCKSCRRYWTKGGVLRNVPIGGGCRKSKRSSSKSPSTKPPPSPSFSTAKSQAHDHADASATAAAAAASATPAATTAAGASGIPTIFHELRSTTAPSLYGVEDIAMDNQQDVGCGGGREGVMSEMGNFPSLMRSTTTGPGGFGYAGMMSEQEERGEVVDVEGFGALDWDGESNGGDGGGEVGMFEVTGAVGHHHASYWSQQNHHQWKTASADDVLGDDHLHLHHRGGIDDHGLFLP
ncbi:hypothetical protein MLD38_039347 [Melastoma candidum]|uniref:Uncharacterized protein n=1 Tax=Melastoma candidum TaxID=119954 RepID=A0ACB9L2U6_9MYRT|nr:hypothetical protein MLD38_039347 [Melastoma candidum]